MNINDVVIIGVKSRIMALSKLDGQILWSTTLPGGINPFVTALADGQRVFAHAHGQIHCLDLTTGRLLWSNELSGCGYGFASLAFPNGAVAPDPALAAAMAAAQQATTETAASSAAQ